MTEIVSIVPGIMIGRGFVFVTAEDVDEGMEDEDAARVGSIRL
jgi:hypothetical protein